MVHRTSQKPRVFSPFLLAQSGKTPFFIQYMSGLSLHKTSAAGSVRSRMAGAQIRSLHFCFKTP
jgi:hypothetical protein